MPSNTPPDWIVPDWPAPARVRAVSTLRTGGVSTSPYASFNLGQHVGDAPEAVAENRRRLMDRLGLRQEPRWLKQVHGTRVVELDGRPIHGEADAAFTRTHGEVCVIMTADCMPVLFCDRGATVVAAAHAGWRGLAAGVLEKTIQAMDVAPGELLAWMGPAIGPESYEVGDEVMEVFVDTDVHATGAFLHKPNGKWLCDLYSLAQMRLEAVGVKNISGGEYCTLKDRGMFYSHRRDGECGRMGTMVWIEG